MAPPHVSGVDLHLQMKDIKTIEELPKKTILGKRKKRDGEEEEDGQGIWNKKNQYFGHHSIDKKNLVWNIVATEGYE